MANFKADIIEAVAGDNILAVTFPKIEIQDERYAPANALANTILTYRQALAVLDYEYDPSYGSIECHNIKMWSADWVYYIHEYDGSTSIEAIERNPPIQS